MNITKGSDEHRINFGGDEVVLPCEVQVGSKHIDVGGLNGLHVAQQNSYQQDLSSHAQEHK